MSIFFANNLAYLRKKRGMTQAEVANSLNLKRNTFSNYETTHSEPDLDTLGKIASFFDISIDQLVNTDLTKENLIEYREEKEVKEGKEKNSKTNIPGNLTAAKR